MSTVLGASTSHGRRRRRRSSKPIGKTMGRYEVLSGVVVMISALGHHQGVVEETFERVLRVRVLTGAQRGRLVRVAGDAVTALQPAVGVNASLPTASLVKVLDGPLQGRVGSLAMVVEVDGDDSDEDEPPRLEGLVRFGGMRTAILPMSLLAVWRGIGPR